MPICIHSYIKKNPIKTPTNPKYTRGHKKKGNIFFDVSYIPFLNSSISFFRLCRSRSSFLNSG